MPVDASISPSSGYSHKTTIVAALVFAFGLQYVTYRCCHVQDAITLVSAMGGFVSEDDYPFVGPSRMSFGSPMPRQEWIAVNDRQLLLGLPLLSHLTRVTTVGVRDCPDVTESSIAPFLETFEIENLYLRNTGISDNALRHIAMEDAMVELDISGTSVTADGICLLSEMPNLKRLYAENIDLTAEQIAHVESRLQDVDIHWTEKGDAAH